MSPSPRLGLTSAVVHAASSILGSGILFLPGATVAAAGTNAAWSWLAATLLCLLLVPLFTLLIKRADSSRGMNGLLELGLGLRASRGIGPLVLGTVCFGMPASALIAGEFAARLGPTCAWLKPALALSVIVVPIMANLAGARINSRIQLFATLSVIAVAALVLAWSWGFQASPISQTAPSGNGVSGVMAGTLLAFWAFAGFENLAFMSAEFENPRRDIPRAMLVAILVCGTLYILLASNYAALVPQSEVDSKLGLMQLAERSSGANFLAPATAALAALSIFVNFNSWFWGVSRLAATAGSDQILPSSFVRTNRAGTPWLALLWIGVFQVGVVCVMLRHTAAFDWAIRQVSLNFVFIYVLVLASAVRVLWIERVWLWTACALVALAFLAVMLSQGWLVLYPLALYFGFPAIRRNETPAAGATSR